MALLQIQFALFRKLNAPAKFRIEVKALGWSLADGADLPFAEGAQMARRKLSPREIVERLQMIEDLTADGRPIGEAIRSAGVLQVEYDRWLNEYNGLRRTLGPLLLAPPMPPKKWRRAGRPSSK
jgi:hypothetical protein